MAWRQSEIDRACECGWFERAAAEPRVPIEFDERLGEFHLLYDTPDQPLGGRLTFYYCPFCGCRAPESKRATLFAILTQEEISRLEGLCDGLTTLAAVRAKLGEPDEERAAGVGEQQPEKDGQAPTAVSFRTLTYRGLSELADVFFVDRHEAGMRPMFVGKYIGPKRD
jgi:hypothetical protein